jgi:TolB-like protein/DNA-binding winged helix-turn-helix (wHTH) protein
MEKKASNTCRVAFDQFEVDLCSGEILKSGRKLRLQAQPFKLLALLLEHHGELVTREEIRGRLWQADIFVDFDHSLSTAINKIRGALGDSADCPRFVETLSRRGYRFIGKITDTNADTAPKSVPLPSDVAAIDPLQTDPLPSSVPSPASRQSPKYDFRPVLILAAALAALALVLAVGKPRGTRAKAEAANIRSIAVLPFENLSGNPADQYFADGMTDELITELAKSKGLRVVSRTSVMQYKGVHRPVKDLAQELGVDGILEGSVLVDHARVRISVQLVHAPSDTPIWAHSYIRDDNDLLLLQHDLAENVAKEVDGAALPSKTSQSSRKPFSSSPITRQPIAASPITTSLELRRESWSPETPFLRARRWHEGRWTWTILLPIYITPWLLCIYFTYGIGPRPRRSQKRRLN